MLIIYIIALALFSLAFAEATKSLIIIDSHGQEVSNINFSDGDGEDVQEYAISMRDIPSTAVIINLSVSNGNTFAIEPCVLEFSADDNTPQVIKIRAIAVLSESETVVNAQIDFRISFRPSSDYGCQVVDDSIPIYHHVRPGRTCWADGDPRVHPFDGMRGSDDFYRAYGSPNQAYYMLKHVETSVIITQYDCDGGGVTEGAPTCIDRIAVRHRGTILTVELAKSEKGMNSGHNPLPESNVIITSKGETAEITLLKKEIVHGKPGHRITFTLADGSVVVVWSYAWEFGNGKDKHISWYLNLKVTLPGSYSNRIGNYLCGNFDYIAESRAQMEGGDGGKSLVGKFRVAPEDDYFTCGVDCPSVHSRSLESCTNRLVTPEFCTPELHSSSVSTPSSTSDIVEDSSSSISTADYVTTTMPHLSTTSSLWLSVSETIGKSTGFTASSAPPLDTSSQISPSVSASEMISSTPVTTVTTQGAVSSAQISPSISASDMISSTPIETVTTQGVSSAPIETATSQAVPTTTSFAAASSSPSPTETPICIDVQPIYVAVPQSEPNETTLQYCQRVIPSRVSCLASGIQLLVAECSDSSLERLVDRAQQIVNEARIQCSERAERLLQSPFISDRAIGKSLFACGSLKIKRCDRPCSFKCPK